MGSHGGLPNVCVGWSLVVITLVVTSGWGVLAQTCNFPSCTWQNPNNTDVGTVDQIEAFCSSWLSERPCFEETLANISQDAFDCLDELSRWASHVTQNDFLCTDAGKTGLLDDYGCISMEAASAEKQTCAINYFPTNNMFSTAIADQFIIHCMNIWAHPPYWECLAQQFTGCGNSAVTFAANLLREQHAPYINHYCYSIDPRSACRRLITCGQPPYDPSLDRAGLARSQCSQWSAYEPCYNDEENSMYCNDTTLPGIFGYSETFSDDYFCSDDWITGFLEFSECNTTSIEETLDACQLPPPAVLILNFCSELMDYIDCISSQYSVCGSHAPDWYKRLLIKSYTENAIFEVCFPDRDLMTTTPGDANSAWNCVYSAHRPLMLVFSVLHLISSMSTTRFLD